MNEEIERRAPRGEMQLLAAELRETEGLAVISDDHRSGLAGSSKGKQGR